MKLSTTIGLFDDASFTGYLSDYIWNGFDDPYFEKDEADRVVAYINEMEEANDSRCWMEYNEEADAYYYHDDKESPLPVAVWFGEDIDIGGVPYHLYNIGGGSWCWMTDGPEDEDVITRALEVAVEVSTGSRRYLTDEELEIVGRILKGRTL